MSNENNEIQTTQVEKKLIEISLVEYEKKIDMERAYLIRKGMNPDKARKEAKEIIDKEYIKVSNSVDYSNWAGQHSDKK